MLSDSALNRFVRESNLIEGIDRDPTKSELTAHKGVLTEEFLSLTTMSAFVQICADAPIRYSHYMNVQVGNHVAPRGGDQVCRAAEWLLSSDYAPFHAHNMWMWLHPYMDGNGRSGRALWLRAMIRVGRSKHVEELGFLHAFYYQTLQHLDHESQELWRNAGFEFK